jgi:hypothetical protein
LNEDITTPGIKECWLPVAQLMNACFGGKLSVVQKLLEKGVKPDERSELDWRTPLLAASFAQQDLIVKRLHETPWSILKRWT